MGSLGARASDYRPEGLGSMPDVSKYPTSTHGLRAREISSLKASKQRRNDEADRTHLVAPLPVMTGGLCS
ncbi:hypothetical protein TNCV_3367851 [Trichonephila clavipes]|nr:hypothetical protein TNCV_3367851 [Trichonephila clavipes]